ncbi:hypothetical protein GQ55_4G241500 [Panicum hallii var. hallii]|uniref:Uncharacterized protein n=1 Tax=Panicum hallii var. hallii TaxID=1504633 RepID=A0A2T7DZS6_9POAL|nr:hypothetical protein GQ55_4G241500 [Panicum hallii var. hallii]
MLPSSSPLSCRLLALSPLSSGLPTSSPLSSRLPAPSVAAFPVLQAAGGLSSPPLSSTPPAPSPRLPCPPGHRLPLRTSATTDRPTTATSSRL